jgi:hypothetical protein
LLDRPGHPHLFLLQSTDHYDERSYAHWQGLMLASVTGALRFAVPIHAKANFFQGKSVRIIAPVEVCPSNEKYILMTANTHIFRAKN